MRNFFNKSLFLLIALTVCFCQCRVFSQDLKSAIKLTVSEQFDAAAKEYKAVMKNEQKNGDCYYYYAENFLSSYFVDTAGSSLTEMIDSALVILKKGSQSDPFNPLVYVGLGKTSLYKGDTVVARNYFDKAISFLPSKKNKNSSIPKDRQALIYSKIAEGYIIALRDTNKVFAFLHKAQELDPKNPEIYILLGDAYMNFYTDGTNSIANYDKAKQLDPKSPLAKIKIGSIYVRSRNLKAAIPVFEEAVLIDSTFAPVYRSLGELYYRAGRYEQAKSNYEKFLSLSNKNISAKTRYVSFLYLTQNYSEAIKVIDEIRLVDSSSNLLNRLAAYSYFELKNYNDGLKSIENFFRKTKPDKILPSDYYYYGKILSKLDKDSLAIIKYNLAYKLDTTNYDLLTDLASSYNKVKNLTGAADALQKKVNAGKATDIDLYYLGKDYYISKQWPKADTAFALFIQRQPESMNGLIMRARTKTNIDTTSKSGLAIPLYLKVIEKAKTDSVKYSRELIESYDFLGGYNVLVTKDFKKAKFYYSSIIAIDPKNEKAKNILKTKELMSIR